MTDFLPAPTRDADGVAFQDHRRTTWRAREIGATHLPAGQGPRCLVLSSDAGTKHLWDYPAGWRSLSAEALVALLSSS